MMNRFLDELRENPRLRWGVALIAGIAWLYIVLLMRDALQEREQQYRAANQSVVRLRAQLAQPEWPERVVPAKTLAVQMESRLWQAPTAGLAQAAFQDWLNAAMTTAGAAHPQITVTAADEGPSNASSPAGDSAVPSDLWKVRARLGFDFSVPVLTNFMGRIEGSEKQIVADALNVRKEPSPRVEMELYGYFQKPAPAAKPEEKDTVR